VTSTCLLLIFPCRSIVLGWCQTLLSVRVLRLLVCACSRSLHSSGSFVAFAFVAALLSQPRAVQFLFIYLLLFMTSLLTRVVFCCVWLESGATLREWVTSEPVEREIFRRFRNFLSTHTDEHGNNVRCRTATSLSHACERLSMLYMVSLWCACMCVSVSVAHTLEILPFLVLSAAAIIDHRNVLGLRYHTHPISRHTHLLSSSLATSHTPPLFLPSHQHHLFFFTVSPRPPAILRVTLAHTLLRATNHRCTWSECGPCASPTESHSWCRTQTFAPFSQCWPFTSPMPPWRCS
jgi:hypothetical protein